MTATDTAIDTVICCLDLVIVGLDETSEPPVSRMQLAVIAGAFVLTVVMVVDLWRRDRR